MCTCFLSGREKNRRKGREKGKGRKMKNRSKRIEGKEKRERK